MGTYEAYNGRPHAVRNSIPQYPRREPGFRATKHFVPGRSFAKSDPLNADFA